MSNKTEKQKPSEVEYLASPKAFHLEMPLYLTFDVRVRDTKKRIYELMMFLGTIDAYCIWGKKASVFSASRSSNWAFAAWERQIEGNLQTFGWSCAHNDSHYYRSYYFLENHIFQKIGQLPSVADFQIPQAEKYRKILGEEQYKELTRGIGLAAHGVGIGSFVYLRRVFENLIEKAHIIESNKSEFNEEHYKRARMDERIEILKENLPDFLVENKSLYSILSKGIHDLTEEECLKYFDAVKIGIEQILDEEIEQIEKAQKASLARKVIQGITHEVSNETPSELNDRASHAPE